MKKKKSEGARKPKRRQIKDIAKHEWAIETYLKSIPTINSEAARSQRFTLLLQNLFGVEPGFIEEYVQGVEKYITSRGRDRIVRGRADQLSGNLIIEFERDLSSAPKIGEAEEQLRRYTACIWSQEDRQRRTKFVCLATDGCRFRAYAPALSVKQGEAILPETITLRLLEDVNATRVRWDEFYFFLDRYLLRREILHPTGARIIKDFGPTSHAFQVARDILLERWETLRDHPDYGVLYEAWDKYLRIVYGSSLADSELFVRHTYLATLAKLMVWARLAMKTEPPDDEEILAILEGSFFKEQLGIENFLEEDFFSWIARPEAEPTAVHTAHILLGLLKNYDLGEISEDVFKALYEGLVDPETRHDLGEYYTPDWLAHRMVRKLLTPKPKASVLDPACGSGTFLYMAIREKRRLLRDSAWTAKHILAAVVGMDIHPLACIIAKANYVLALGDLMMRRTGRISIPVYLANSIRPPELELERGLWQQVACYRTEIDGRKVYIPESLIQDSAKYDEAIDAARDYASHTKGKHADSEGFGKYLSASHPGLLQDEQAILVLYSVAETLKEMIDVGRDTIWAFVLKNIYKPLFLRGCFDLVVGNPPWLSYRYVERSDYQMFVKESAVSGYGLLRGRGELVTHLELGTLFLVRAVDLYLKKRGTIAFVLPKSIFSADQHDALRRGKIKNVTLRAAELWDLEEVTPLFKISAAVYIGRQSRKAVGAPIPGEIIEGELEVRNASLKDAEKDLTTRKAKFSLSTMGKRSYWSVGRKTEVAESPYRDRFREGATIVPRCFWFVDLKPSELGYDASLPPLISSDRSRKEAKAAYKGCVIQGNVESRFIFATLLPVDMVPFGAIRFRPVVLPVIIEQGIYRLLSAGELRAGGFMHLAKWTETAEREWTARRGEKAKNMTMLQRLDYAGGIHQQAAKTQFWVAYAKSGTHVCACLVEKEAIVNLDFRGMKYQSFVVDHTLYSLELSDADEGRFLVSVLNAPVVDQRIKAAQARGLWGARDVHKKVLDLPIPKFDPQSDRHGRLAEIGETCADRVKEWIDSGGPGATRSIGVLRGRVREMLEEELAEIDAIVKPMLGL
jgi:methylase of polypeptide subunit release factors